LRKTDGDLVTNVERQKYWILAGLVFAFLDSLTTWWAFVQYDDAREMNPLMADVMERVGLMAVVLGRFVFGVAVLVFAFHVWKSIASYHRPGWISRRQWKRWLMSPPWRRRLTISLGLWAVRLAVIQWGVVVTWNIYAIQQRSSVA